MAGSSLGRIFRLSTFGESHGPALGGVVDGCPAGLPLDAAFLQSRLDRRRPGGQSAALSGAAALAGTTRKEADRVRILSGIFEGRTTGTPIAFCIENQDQRSHDYGALAHTYRPGHADRAYDAKYGLRDHRGGGRSSGRETAARVAGGAIAEALLAHHGISVLAATVELGGIPVTEVNMDGAVQQPFFAADTHVVPQWESLITETRGAGDTLGGIVQIVVRGVPEGLGEPVFDKLDACLAAALMSVGAVKGVEVGDGFAAARSRGSLNNDHMVPCSADNTNETGKAGAAAQYLSNHAGGILGGISSGQDIIVRAAVKPIPSIALQQRTVDNQGRATTVVVGGRHDICAIPRIVPVLAAMTALTLADALLLQSRMHMAEREHENSPSQGCAKARS